MKKLGKFLIFLLFFVLPFQVHGQLGIGDAAVASILEKIHADQVISYAQFIAQMINTAQNTYNQIQMMIEAEKRALANLKSVADVKSWDDFMKWQNRQLYLERQTEDYFNDIGIQIGSETYQLAEIDEIPEALENSFRDEFTSDFTEEERAEMYYKLGLSPSNYMYIKTWQQREDMLARRILSQKGALDAENEEAARRNAEVMARYTREDGSIDTNKILKETGITLSNMEMVLRDLTRITLEKHEYDLARDKQADAPANPPESHEHLMRDYWKPITTGSGTSEYFN